MTMRVVAIVQARMRSTRLPGKVLKLVLDRPLLDYLVERLRRSRAINELVIATSTHPADDAIADYCRRNGVACYRGSEDDVLARYMDAATEFAADVIVRISADSPLIDPGVVDELVEEFLATTPTCDYLSNTINQTYPLGMNTEVFSYRALRQAHREATLSYDREHVTPFLYHNRDRFAVCENHHQPDLSGLRLTVDVPEDLELVTVILERLHAGNPEFTLSDIAQLYEREPELRNINSHIRQTPRTRAASSDSWRSDSHSVLKGPMNDE